MSAGLTSGGDTTGSTGSSVACTDGSATQLISVSRIGEKKSMKVAYHILRPILRRWMSRHLRNIGRSRVSRHRRCRNNLKPTLLPLISFRFGSYCRFFRMTFMYVLDILLDLQAYLLKDMTTSTRINAFLRSRVVSSRMVACP